MKRIYLLAPLFFICGELLAGQNGVIIHQKDKVDDCYRLISSRNLSAAHLINPQGRYVHTWSYNHQNTPASDFSEFGMKWHYAEMLPNGNLVAIIKDEKIIELDWNNKLVWETNIRAHHDFARLENGNTIVVSRKDKPNPWQKDKMLAIDELVEFDINGNKVWQWDYAEHLAEIAKLALQPVPPDKSFRDWPHINTCEVLPPNPLSKNDDRFKAGNLLLCGRHSNTIFIIDKKSGQIVWAWGPGVLEGPHMPTMLKNGNILVYDNGHHLSKNSRGYTRVLEINPLNGKILWQYQAKKNSDIFSPSRGSNDRLSNGNTLIAESDSGHLIEVTHEGDIVWEFWNPDRNNNKKRMPLYRVVPYKAKIVGPLLRQHGLAKDVIKEHQEKLKWETLGPDHQYKRYLREVVFYCELGYYDFALNFLDEFLKVFPNDPEGYFGYSLVYSARKNGDLSYKYMIKAIEGGLPLDRFTVKLGGLFNSLYENSSFKGFIKKQNNFLVHGPVLSKLGPNSTEFWVRTFGEQKVQIIARQKSHIDFNIRSTPVTTSEKHEYTAVLKLVALLPKTIYEYQVLLNDTPCTDIVTCKTAALAEEKTRFSLGFGGGAGATPKYERMWDTIKSHSLNLFLLLGDNVYIDHPERPITQKFCYYRRQSRPEYKRFFATTPLYAIWDDHDFTFNDGKGSPEVNTPAWKMDVWRVFKNQFNNPYYGGGEKAPGCWFDFSYGDVDFIMLDCRYYREQPNGNPKASMLGVIQKKWLFEKLLHSQATFKVIASSVPWAEGTKPGSLDTWDGHPREREEIFSFIENNHIEGVLLISADRHRSDAWKIRRPNGYDLYDFESSKISNIHTHKIMPGSLFGYNKKCSFGLLEFDTTISDPSITYRIISIDNEEIHRLTLFKSDLSFLNNN